MAEQVPNRETAELAEKVASTADLHVNVVLRVLYALKEHGYAVTPSDVTSSTGDSQPAAVSRAGKSSKSAVATPPDA